MNCHNLEREDHGMMKRGLMLWSLSFYGRFQSVVVAQPECLLFSTPPLRGRAARWTGVRLSGVSVVLRG